MLSLASSAQQFNEKQVQLIEGNTYYLHKIEKGNTLYSLSKMYSVKIKDLISENPQLEEGLKVGQVIRIPVKKVDTKKAADNPPKAEGSFLVHTVAPKETLYALSRKYEVSTEELQKVNPELKDGLKEGMQIKIPVAAVEADVEEIEIAPAVEDSFELHFVEPKETLYSLAKDYNVNIDSIRLINNGLKEGLKIGTTIRLPIKKTPFSAESAGGLMDDIIPLVIDSGKKKDVYQIALMLPFYFDLNDTIEAKRKEFEQEQIYKGSAVAFGIYSGIKIALDSLRNKGYKCKLLVYDTKYDRRSRSTVVVEEILANDQELYNTDLFIGPLFRPNFEVVQQYANALGIATVSPVPQHNSILDSNQYSLKVNTGHKAQVDFIRNASMELYKDKNLIVVENNELKDVLLAEHFWGINNGDTNLSVYNAVNSNFERLKIWDFDTAKTKHKLIDSLPNVLVLPLNSKSFVTRMLNALNRYSQDYDITVIGMDSWSTIGYLDIKYLNNLKVHIPYNQFVDYNHSSVDDFIGRYRKSYFSDPDEWAFLGYDIGMYFLEGLHQGGTRFYDSQTDTYAGVSKNISFKKQGPVNGYENTSLKLVKMENYFYVGVK